MERGWFCWKPPSGTETVTGMKIAAGACISIVLAEAFGLRYASSAGVITLLSVLGTKKETLRVALRRLFAFAAAMVLANILFFLLGYEVWVFGVFLFLFYLSVKALHIAEGFSMSAVLVTHLLGEGSFAWKAVANETVLFALGVAAGVAANWYMPDRTSLIRRLQGQAEEQMRGCLKCLSMALLEPEGEKRELNCRIAALQEGLEEMQKEAAAYLGNTFAKEADYFRRYVRMRMDQEKILEDMAEKCMSLTEAVPQAAALADLLARIGDCFHETNNAAGLLREYEGLRRHYVEEELPKTRAEFENRAVLFHILQMVEYFLKCKLEFARGLSREEYEKYWK